METMQDLLEVAKTGFLQSFFDIYILPILIIGIIASVCMLHHLFRKYSLRKDDTKAIEDLREQLKKEEVDSRC